MSSSRIKKLLKMSFISIPKRENLIAFLIIRIRLLFPLMKGINKERRDCPLIVTLTSFPRRFSLLHLCICSLLHQSVKADRIILWISEEEIKKSPLPPRVTRLQKYGLEIRIMKENLKSFKKIFYVYKEFPEAILITIDDDFIFPYRHIENLYTSYKKNPSCISATQVRLMEKRGTDSLRTYHNWQNLSCADEPPSFRFFPLNGKGTLFPPHSLNPEISNKRFMQLCPLADDVWIKAMSLLQKTPVVITGKELPIEIRKWDSNLAEKDKCKKILWKKNKYLNDIQIKAVFDYYHLYDMLDEQL